MNNTKDFFEAYPEAKDILPISSPEIMRRWLDDTNKSNTSSSHTEELPTAKREYGKRFIMHFNSSLREKKQLKQEIADKYISLFKMRIKELLGFVGPKTFDKRIQDILDIREEFFAYPVNIERNLLDTFHSKRIEFWSDISESSFTQDNPFRDYYVDALRYSADSIPFFEQKKHFLSYFSGFVNQVLIIPEELNIDNTAFFDALGAYIQNGKIIWSVQYDTNSNKKYITVKWYSGNFVLEEKLINYWYNGIEEEGLIPISKKKVATFKFDNPLIMKVTITQTINNDKEEEFNINITKHDNTCMIIIINQTTGKELISKLKNDPYFLSKIDNVIKILN